MTRDAPAPRSVVLAIAVFRRLSALMPRAYRRRHRDEAIAVMTELAAEAYRDHGAVGVWRATAAAAFDLLLRLPAEYRSGASLDVLRGDVRYAWRSLSRRPLSTIAAIATLAIGIGLNAAVFSIADWVLFRPLPYPSPHELVRVLSAGVGPATRPGDVTYSEFQRYSRATMLRAAAAFSTATRVVSGPNLDPTHVTVARVTGDLFGTLGVSLALGRGLGNAETAPVIVLADSLWRNRFDSDRLVVGRVVTIDRQPFTIVGVMPPGRGYPANADLWRPMTAQEREDNDRELVTIARLAPGASEERLAVELSTLADVASQKGRRPIVESVQRTEVRDVRATVIALLVSSLLVLAMACANVAALISARRADRTGEMAVRGALGASRSRLMCQLFTEGVMLAAAGGIAGLVIGRSVLDAVVALAPATLPRLAEITLDARIVAAGIAATSVVGLIVGVGPAWDASRLDLRSSLGAAGGSRTTAHARGRRMLVVVQTAMALVLSISAALLARSLHHLVTIDHGFDADRLLAVDLYLRGGVARDERALFRELIENAEAIPGVRSAAVTLRLPTEVAGLRTIVSREGQQPARGAPPATLRTVSHRYFETAGIPLLAGRAFTAADRRGAPTVAIVNASFLRDLLGGEQSVGAKLTIDLVDKPLTLIGIVADVTPAGERDRPALYVPMEQILVAGGSLLVRTDRDPQSIVPELTTRLRAVAPALARDRIRPVSDALVAGRAVTRFSTQVASGFAFLALLLASIGLYGLTAGEVVARWRELAVRMALGATQREMLWSVVRPGTTTLAVGLAIGLAASMAAARWMATLLHGVSPTDPQTLLLVPVLLIAVGLTAATIAGLRVMRADPAATLRGE